MVYSFVWRALVLVSVGDLVWAERLEIRIILIMKPMIIR